MTFRAMVEVYLATWTVEPGTVLTYRSNLGRRWNAGATVRLT